MTRVVLDDYRDDTVAGDDSDITLYPEIPAGETWVLRRFGGALRGRGVVALQLRTAVGPPDTWVTLRAVIGPGHAEFEIDRGYAGDGVNRFRVVRLEESGSAQDIISWIEGFKK